MEVKRSRPETVMDYLFSKNSPGLRREGRVVDTKDDIAKKPLGSCRKIRAQPGKPADCRYEKNIKSFLIAESGGQIILPEAWVRFSRWRGELLKPLSSQNEIIYNS
ncbi:hypothetical protein GWI33_013587 [Rhynchophorus ferrugineus]|uniref:Uncharacterized protein n=1 Tax=Rhynchophorus ferrugineus TaxID=354439 RepID=A0A834I8W9_RHYFE|nr:hypothetical protein GWI33_013587 [Rhynchophorus ferrugineus]